MQNAARAAAADLATLNDPGPSHATVQDRVLRLFQAQAQQRTPAGSQLALQLSERVE